MFVADANVLVYAADQDSPAHARCRALVEEWRARSSAWYVTWPIVTDFHRFPFVEPIDPLAGS